MHQAANLQFERIVDEFVRWRAIKEDERSPAPAWWWGPAFEAAEYRSDAAGRIGAPGWDWPMARPIAAGAGIVLNIARGPDLSAVAVRFSSKRDSTDSDVRDLHVQPSDDSAFPP